MVFLFEPYIRFQVIDFFLHGVGYKALFVSEVNGYVGGIWSLVPLNTNISFQVIYSSARMININLQYDNCSWFCTGIYCNPVHALRDLDWNHLHDMVVSIGDHHWLVLGDFNDILLPSEQLGCCFLLNRASKFSDCLDACNLFSLYSHGPLFTWGEES